MAHLSVAGLSLTYNTTQLFSDLSLDIPEQKLTTLIGPNGSGKSTLLRCMCGLQHPQQGKILLGGKALGDYRQSELAKIRAFMPQHTITPEAMNLRHLVECGRYAYQGLLGGASAEDREAVEWAMEVCGVAQFATRQVAALSGGERQRAWLASALAQKAPILILDEPCSYLDISYQIELMELLRRLVDEQGLTVIMSTHDLNHSAQYADRLVAMKSGAIIAEGDVTQILSDALVHRLFGVRTEIQTSTVSGKSFCIFHAA